MNDRLDLVVRGEVWRDQQGFFVAAFPGNKDFVNIQRGFPAQSISGGRTTYGALTFGVNYKPALLPALEGMVVRPEVRYDRSLNDTDPFDGSKDQFTFGADVIIPF